MVPFDDIPAFDGAISIVDRYSLEPYVQLLSKECEAFPVPGIPKEESPPAFILFTSSEDSFGTTLALAGLMWLTDSLGYLPMHRLMPLEHHA